MSPWDYEYESPLLEGKLLRRYKRFFADVELEAPHGIVTAHVANTGSLKEVLTLGGLCRLSLSKNPDRKLPWSLEQVQAPSGAWVGVNTQVPNHIVRRAHAKGFFESWKKSYNLKSEVKISKETRLDFCLEFQGEIQKYIEVKNVTLARRGRAEFPDAETLRGQKHIDELLNLLGKGFGVELLFVVQREDVDRFAAAADFDPIYAKKLKEAQKAGVEIKAYKCKVTPQGIGLLAGSLSVE